MYIMYMPSPAQTTFKLGLSYLPLANAGLDALESWSAQLSPSVVGPHLRHILPSLDDYLKTSSTGGELMSAMLGGTGHVAHRQHR